IAQQTESRAIESLHDLLQEEVKRIQDHERGLITGVPSGFVELDNLTTGFQNAEMIIFAARPSMGKTALALNFAEYMALHGNRVGIFSLEMSKQQLVQRLLCARANIESQKLRRRMLNKEDHMRLMDACGDLENAPIFIDDTPGLTLLQLRTKARRMVSKHKVQALLVDYLQLLSTGTRTESRQVEVGEISRGIKAMGRELNIPVICLSQLNRGPEDRMGNRPRMSDLRESGSLEQDADVVALIHREEYYHQGEDKWHEEMEEFALGGQPEKDLRGVAELIIAKQRNGPTGTVKLSWISQSTRFRDYHAGLPPRGLQGPKSTPHPVYQGASVRTGPVENFREGGGPDRDAATDHGDDVPF
ncbi:MAG: replicative DNA helicase, partial [Phycisphaerales bacterium]|nr:replicative DNA helicase [Phycisphaerales bacterium]